MHFLYLLPCDVQALLVTWERRQRDQWLDTGSHVDTWDEVELVEALRYKPEGREFDSQWCHCNFSLT